ncbi:NUDIX domain-containing protein [Roseibium sp. RKSG952]|uniref:NUDIX domain-containing protein n=1 Tax=Roseibium sp. RKSG952 TaxID=2529384 RepID=UPI0012BC158C|nr:NUDIX domain-containing protein [Roseibium sp. RKSG952]MTH98423.1 NUDIX domain-containing protein [Roseibium sp. RKSG952]
MTKKRIIKSTAGFKTKAVLLSIHVWGWLVRSVTLGVRVILLDDRHRVLLVKHSYLPGWYLPGGAVDRGETAGHAAVRECCEEVGVVIEGSPRLLGLYLNRRGLGRDHVALYFAGTWSKTPGFLKANMEISEAGFFAFDDLPDDTSDATRKRLRDFQAQTLSGDGEW